MKPQTVRGFIEEWQKVATGILGWMPATFWRSTLTEIIVAAEGRFPGKKPAPLGADENAALEAQFREKQARRRKAKG